MVRELGRQELSLENVHSLDFHIGVTGICWDTGETENRDCLASSGAMQVPVFRSRVPLSSEAKTNQETLE